MWRCNRAYFFIENEHNPSGKGWDERARKAAGSGVGVLQRSEQFGDPYTHAQESATFVSEDVQCLKHLELCSWKLDCTDAPRICYHLVNLLPASKPQSS